MHFKFLTIAFVILMPASCCAQADNDSLIEQVMEYIAENISEDQDYSEITERLNFYRKYPLDINKVRKEQLHELVFISPVQIEKLLRHREESGLFLDLLELQSIDGFDDETARWLSNFLILNPPELFSDLSLSKLFKNGEHDLMIRFGKILQQQDGFLSSDSIKAIYSGSADRIFTRYRFNYANKVLLSLNMEKDAGEAFLGKTGKGFDFYSANIFLKGNRFLKELVVGDYALQFGQGLTMWSGLGFGKGAELTSVAKQGAGLRPYSSVNEFSFLRGVSATVDYGNVSITPFISYKKMDASLSNDQSEIKSLPISGLHRTNSEQKGKNAVTQLVYGTNAEYLKNELAVGITAYKTQLDKPLASSKTLYERYDFADKILTNLGLHYTYTFRNTYFFGEAAHSLSSGTGFLNGLMSSLSRRVSGVVLYRNYARNYYSFFNQGLSESTEAINEKGIYTGLNIQFSSKVELAGYFDLFRFPWLKFRVDAPSRGHELFGQLSYSLSKKFKIAARFKLQQKEENATEISPVGGLENVEKQNYRLELSYKLSNSFSIRNRVEVSAYKKGLANKEFGFLSYQDVIYKPLSSSFSGNVRFAIFDTQGFNSRIYAYENDVLYGYSVPAYQGRGLRCYLNGRYTVRRGIDVWLRYALSSYADQETVGSGYDIIKGSKRSDFKLQLRFQF
ncbi:helix-hairpin-helix domain-containing protein [Daejeonella sp.]|uniref:ComEA family DNA-binding protein n=1 Tax=Daejeonella sp. TaxID=2805397 RepID=UPI0030C00168